MFKPWKITYDIIRYSSSIVVMYDELQKVQKRLSPLLESYTKSVTSLSEMINDNVALNVPIGTSNVYKEAVVSWLCKELKQRQQFFNP